MDGKVLLNAQFIVEVGLCLGCCLLLKKFTSGIARFGDHLGRVCCRASEDEGLEVGRVSGLKLGLR